MNAGRSARPKIDPRRAGAGFVAAGCALCLLILTFLVSTSALEGALTWTLILLGAAGGWLIGLIASPYDPREEARFAKYAGVISAFASGYLVAKLDPLLNYIAKPEFLLASTNGFRIVSFLISLIVATAYTHAVRSYRSHFEGDEPVAPVGAGANA